MITKRELKEKGYHYYGNYADREGANNTASTLRRLGDNATVVIESRRGIVSYSVWSRRKGC